MYLLAYRLSFRVSVFKIGIHPCPRSVLPQYTAPCCSPHMIVHNSLKGSLKCSIAQDNDVCVKPSSELLPALVRSSKHEGFFETVEFAEVPPDLDLLRLPLAHSPSDALSSLQHCYRGCPCILTPLQYRMGYDGTCIDETSEDTGSFLAHSIARHATRFFVVCVSSISLP